MLFSSVAEQTFNAGSGERFVGQMLGLDVSGKNWYLMFSSKWDNWSSSDQSFFLYGDGYRGSYPYFLFNLYNDVNANNPRLFTAGKGPSIYIPIVTTITNNTYYDFKLQYTSSNTTYEMFINNVSQGTMSDSAQTMNTLNDILFTPQTATSVKNVYVYEGTP